MQLFNWGIYYPEGHAIYIATPPMQHEGKLCSLADEAINTVDAAEEQPYIFLMTRIS